MTNQEQFARFLRRHADEIAAAAGPMWNETRMPWESLGHRDAAALEQIARELVRLAENDSLRLGAFFATPEGRAVADVVAHEMPALWGVDFDFLVAGLQRAAQLQAEDAPGAGQLALTALGIAAAIGLLLWFSSPRGARQT